MGYMTSNNPPAGELCQRGGMVIPGYYKDEKKTKEVIDDDDSGAAGKIVLAKEEKAHYALGLLSVEHDLERLDLETGEKGP